MSRARILLALILLGIASFLHGGGSAKKAGKAYPFAVAPKEAFAIVAELEKVSGQKQSLAPVEEELFADAAAGKLDKWSFAELAFIASGVADTARRQAYLKQIDRLEAEARKALAEAAT